MSRERANTKVTKAKHEVTEYAGIISGLPIRFFERLLLCLRELRVRSFPGLTPPTPDGQGEWR